MRDRKHKSRYSRNMTTASLRAFAIASANWCARAFQLQLFLTLVSLPILVAWGLPISCMSPVGNCLFTPFLTLFLLLASLMFFGQLLHIPYAPVAYLCNYLTHFWLFLMNYGSSQWLVGIVQLPISVLLAVGLAPFCIVAYKPTRSVGTSIACFLSILVCIYAYSNYIGGQTRITKIPCARGELTLIRTSHEIVLIDPGYLGSVAGACSWVRYTLIPEIIRTTGATHIDHLILLQPMGLGFEAAQELCTLLRIDAVYIPVWDGVLKASHKVRYAKLKESLKVAGTKLVRVGWAKQAIPLSNQQEIITNPAEKQLRIGDITFRAQKLQTQIDNNEVTIYSAKYVNHEVKKQLQEKIQQKK